MPVLGSIQDFEMASDFTIRRTATNQCLDVLLVDKRTSRKYLFPNKAQDNAINNFENKPPEAGFISTNYRHKSLIMQHCKPGSSRFIYDPETSQLVIFEVREGEFGCLTQVNDY